MLNEKILKHVTISLIITIIIYILTKTTDQRGMGILVYGSGTLISFGSFIIKCLSLSKDNSKNQLFIALILLIVSVLSGFLLFKTINSNMYNMIITS